MTIRVQFAAGAREFLKALASEWQRRMLELFTGGMEFTVGAVAERLGMASPTRRGSWPCCAAAGW